MIKFSVLYELDDRAQFDFDYYHRVHAAMVRAKLGDALLDVTLERGIAGLRPTDAPRFAAIASLIFDSTESMRASLYPHIADISADIPNFTDIAPQVFISEVVNPGTATPDGGA